MSHMYLCSKLVRTHIYEKNEGEAWHIYVCIFLIPQEERREKIKGRHGICMYVFFYTAKPIDRSQT